MTFNQTRQRIRRTLGLERYRAILGSPAGVVYDLPGYVHVRYQTIDTTGLKTVVLIGHYVGPMTPGTPVWVGYSVEDELCLLYPDVQGQLANGSNPVLNNPAATVARDDENPFTYVPFTCHPTTPPSLSVVVRPWVYIRNGVVYHYAGGQVDLTASKPAAGNQCLVGIYLKSDNTLETLASTAQSLVTPFDETDLQEVATAASAGSIPGWIWKLTGATTALTDADRLMDARPLISLSDGANPVLFTASADTTVASTAAETSLLSTLNGRQTLPTSALNTTGRTLRVTAAGYVSDTGTPTLQLKFKLGSTAILDSGAVTLGNGISNKLWRFEGLVTVQTVGASGKVKAQGLFYQNGTWTEIVNTSQGSIDTTGTLLVGLTAQWSASSASNTITCSNCVVEVLR